MTQEQAIVGKATGEGRLSTTNSKGADGETLECHICGSEQHMWRKCTAPGAEVFRANQASGALQRHFGGIADIRSSTGASSSGQSDNIGLASTGGDKTHPKIWLPKCHCGVRRAAPARCKFHADREGGYPNYCSYCTSCDEGNACGCPCGGCKHEDDAEDPVNLHTNEVEVTRETKTSNLLDAEKCESNVAHDTDDLDEVHPNESRTLNRFREEWQAEILVSAAARTLDAEVVRTIHETAKEYDQNENLSLIHI